MIRIISFSFPCFGIRLLDNSVKEQDETSIASSAGGTASCCSDMIGIPLRQLFDFGDEIHDAEGLRDDVVLCVTN